ncbi:MAG: hypothetical protein ACFFFT_18870 [Candidatus Thorarchaeota archaeon]
MDRKSEFIIKTIEITTGIIIAYIAYRVSAPITDFAGLFSIIIGLLSTLVLAHLVESYRHSQDIRKMNLNFVNLLEKISERYQDASDLAQILHYGVTTIPGERYFDAFMQLMWRFENKTLAANYIDPNEAWGRAYGDLFNEIQRTKIKVNKTTIRRVFIVDSDEEVDNLRNVMSKQKESGVKVKYIFKSKIETTTMLKNKANRLETLDFDVIDSKYVWLTILDKNRKIEYGKIVFGKEDCERYKSFHDYLFEEAEEIDF